MGSIGPVLAMFAVIILIALGGGFAEEGERTATQERAGQTAATQRNTQSAPEPALSSREVEHRLAQLYRELDALEEEARVARLFAPPSPYRDMVRLGRGNAQADDEAREYVTIDASSGNQRALAVTDWYLESYVTETRAGLPHGIRIPDGRFDRSREDIFLRPGERAVVATDASPLGFSFRENRCTGYFARQVETYPSLSRRCPQPEDELAGFTTIALDNDDCYEFVEGIARCATVTEEAIKQARVSRQCELFVRDMLTYEGCVLNHRHDPLFDNVGSWRIYLNRNDELWRQEREIIRLIDQNDRIIDVVEY